MNDWEIVKSAALLRAFTYTAADSDVETRKDFEDYLVQTGKTVYPRWQYCARKIMDTTGTLSLALAVTYEYQARVFNPTSMRTAAALVANLRSTFKEVIEAANWMDEESKAAAQTKADNIAVLLGYPDFATDAAALEVFYENLPIASWDHYANAKKLRAFQLAYALNMVSYRNRTAWDKSPLDVNAYYNRQNNRIDYSRIGTVIGHEITHGFDGQGFLYNAQGVIERWWTDQTLENFSDNTQCFIDQYSQYPIPEINDTREPEREPGRQWGAAHRAPGLPEAESAGCRQLQAPDWAGAGRCPALFHRLRHYVVQLRVDFLPEVSGGELREHDELPRTSQHASERRRLQYGGVCCGVPVPRGRAHESRNQMPTLVACRLNIILLCCDSVIKIVL
ncbi:hypothetical protein YQE_11233, partial [Dendroctonus ponderosae]